ncbi:MAG: GAF domain-containing protein [Bdellovibrionaceae bacterium]|nr:GAF domain-containing protein [Pseudobdellovibrionaceae bacterium]
MTARNKRLEERISPSLRLSPISCQLRIGEEQIALTIVNYHYRGACFKTDVGDYRLQSPGAYLHFKVGNKSLQEKIGFRIVWETISENGLFGVEFSVESAYVLSRAERFLTHGINAPIVSGRDPLDPNRIVYFKAINVSSTGMLLNTSISNKHMFPGMEIRGAIVEVPNIGKAEVDLFVENSRPSDTDKTIHYGVSVKGNNVGYQELTSKYLSTLGLVSDPSERIDKLLASGFMQRELRTHLTIREVGTQRDYDDVLRLRYLGYKKAGKTKENFTWENMGEGLDQEGIVLAAFLGGQDVASVELRLSDRHSMRLADKVSFASVPALGGRFFIEINKLVVHPSAQKTDIVVGLFQKIHTLAMLNGKPEGLLMAEDKLVPLYLRLGAKKINLSFEHETKPGTRLHVMTIPREVYEDASGINPLAWSHVYETTHSFLNELGLSKENRFSFSKKLQIFGTRMVLSLQERRKKKRVSAKVFSGNELERAGMTGDLPVIDPRWTKQHLHASVLLPYLIVADGLIGKERVGNILMKYGFGHRYFSSASNWISVAFFDEFIAGFRQYGNVDELQKRAGYKNLSREVLGVNHFLLKHFLTLNEAFRAFGSYLTKFNKTRTCQVVESGRGFARIRIGLLDKNLKPKDPSAQLNWEAILDAHVLVMTNRHGEVKKIKSIFDGDEYCEYLVTWKVQVVSTRSVLSAVLAGLVFWQTYSWISERLNRSESVLVISVVALSVLCLIFHRRSKMAQKRYHDMTESLSSFQKDAEERYKELQNSKGILEKGYQEGKIIETLTREIQTSEDLARIFSISINAICEKFEFRRAFAMIVDQDKKYLRTVALKGAGDTSDEIWNFKVDVTVKRDSPLVLSSVYHSGQSILISDIEEHKFHLNEASRRLTDRLKTKGFAMVPIPSENGNWGVMIADKGADTDIITRRDLVALQRVCQAIGLALDKKAKIDSEVRVRKIFEKYVPSAVVESTLGQKEPILGGEIREIVCLFLDIRNFTSLSIQLPPEILVGLLNQIFDLLQQVVKETGGVIDKFLGDGALVTWGAIPGSVADAETALDAAVKFQELLLAWNTQRQSEGIQKIRVGIGIHKGPVISGNIGSQERMEYTVIGQTVNMTSRLEQLSKVFDCEIVISEAMSDFSKLDENWTIHQDVRVRGLDKALRVATRNCGPSGEIVKEGIDEAG